MVKHICIIGSGMGGGTLALTLAERGIPCTIIDAGVDKKNADTVGLENVGLKFGLASTRSIEIGGTSNLWHGILGELDEADFIKRDWIPNSGWPIEKSELKPYYKQAAKLHRVEKYKYFDTKHFPQEMEAQLADMTFDRALLENNIFQQPSPPLRMKERLRIAEKCYPWLTILRDHTGLELFLQKDISKISHIIAGHASGGTTEIHADHFIVAAGGLESSRLLLNSELELGDPCKDNIGRYLMDHPMGNLFQVGFKEEKTAHIYGDRPYGSTMKIKSGLTFQFEVQEKHKLPNHNVYIRPSFSMGIDNKTEKVKLSLLTIRDSKFSFADIWRLLTNFNLLMQILSYQFGLNPKYKFADMFFVTEQIPNPNSRVTLSDKKDRWGYPIAKVNWQLTDQDYQSMEKAYDIIRSEAFGEIDYNYTHDRKDLDWKYIFSSAAHHLGALRMSKGPAAGVVDKNLKVHGINNLYICDGSVFPTSGNVNPSLTISALAIRLADHLISHSTIDKRGQP